MQDSKLEQELIREQEELKKKIVIRSSLDPKSIRTIAGVDIAYWNKGQLEMGVCCICLMDYKSKKVLEKVRYADEVKIPYIPGCLAFRELPLILEAVKNLSMEPDIYMFDGNGLLHPRNMGIATHASLYLGRPSIGIAKSYHKVEGVVFEMPKDEAGAYTKIMVNGKEYGRALRTVKGVKPVFMSVGNGIDSDSCYEITMNMVSDESHIPMPTRYADIETHLARKQIMDEMDMTM